MLRTILTVATCLLLVALGRAQQKIGSNVFTIDRASMLEIESDSSGILLPRLTTTQRDAQIGWDESHLIYNTTDNCLQIYTGSEWDCIVQGVVIDSSIYRHNGTLLEDRVVTMNGFQLTFDGSSDVVITSDGFLGIGDPTPEAKLDVEGGTVRFSDYGSGNNTGSESYLLGVDSEGDVIEVTPAIDTFMIEDDQIKLSLQGDRVPYLSIDLDGIRDTLNIYTDDGTLLSNRIINSGGNFLRYQGTDEGALIELQDDGDIRQFGPQPVFQLIDTSGTEIRITANPSSGFISTLGDQNLIFRQNNTPTIGLLANDRVRLYNYGNDLNTGTLSNLIGVQTDGDLIEIDPALIGSDDQVIDSFALVGNELQISLEDDINGLRTIDLSGIGRNIYNVDDTLTSQRTVTLDGNDLYFEGSTDSLIVSSDGHVRATGTLTLDSFLEDEDGEPGLPGYVLSSTPTGTDWVDPSTISSDDQILDSLGLTGSTLEIGIEGDMNGLQTLDLSVLNENIYNANDDLTSDRTVGLNTFDLLFDGSTRDFVITSNGSVGVGIANPARPLHVNESFRLSRGSDSAAFIFDRYVGTPSTTLKSYIMGVNASGVGTGEFYIADYNEAVSGGGFSRIFTLRDDTDPIRFDQYDGTTFVTGDAVALLGVETDGDVIEVDPSTIGSDNQIIDSLGLVGNELQISIEDDANGLQVLDLSPILGSSENIYNTSASLEADRQVELDGFSLTFDGSSQDLVIHSDGDISIGTATAAGDLNILSTEDQNAFNFTQANGTTGEKDVFTIEDQDAGGAGQDESSVLKIHKSGSINVLDEGFSLVELAYTGATDPTDNKYWISGRTEDEGAPRWGVDITDNDFWSEGGIVLGVSGADGGTYSGGNFIVESDGDVGIGTTSPRARLEVAGGSVIFDEYGIGTHNKTDTGAVKYILAVDTSGAVVELNTAQNTRWFYAPSVSVDASSEVTDATIDLYQEYASQFSSPAVRSPGAPDALPFYRADELFYYVSTFDDQVIDNITITDTGVMEYDIIDVPFDNYTIINIVFVIK